MTQQPDAPHGDGRADQPGIDLGKPGDQPGATAPSAYPPPPPGYPPPPAAGGWPASPPPPPPGQQSAYGGYPPQPQWQGHPGATGQVGSRMTASDERTWAGAAHWSALLAMAVAMAFLGPLLVLLLKGGDSPFVRRQAVESLNFQLTILIAGAVSAVLLFVVVGLLLLPIVGVAWLVFTIIGAVKASSGEDYRYPFSLRMVR